MDAKQLEALVREVLRSMNADGADPASGGAASSGAASAGRRPLPRTDGPSTAPAYCKPRQARPVLPFSEPELARIKAASPARLAQGRAGTRYPTDRYIGLRAEHAIALDAVHSVLPAGFEDELGCIALDSAATDHDDYLLYPDHGRRLSDDSRKVLEAQGTRGADVQIICGDGLSAWALIANGPELLPALVRELGAAGFSVGKPLLARRARVGIQDEIGVTLQAKATVILVGERPGLGTGDSLSIYTAFAPKLGQDNAEKDCISNIRPLGIPTDEAAKECADLLKRTFAAGGGGVHLTRSGT